MPLPSASFLEEADGLDEMAENAKRATAFLKSMGHEGRLMVLCYLASGEKSVTELENLLSLRQPAVSQLLSRLRADGLIEARRDGKAIYYSLCDERARAMMELIYDMFCGSSQSSSITNDCAK